MKTLAAAALSLAVLDAAAADPDLQFSRAGSRPLVAAAAQYFTGEAQVEMFSTRLFDEISQISLDLNLHGPSAAVAARGMSTDTRALRTSARVMVAPVRSGGLSSLATV